MSKGIFVIGTDTNVGKTLITASLGWEISKKVKRLGMMKPFATGIKPYSCKYRSEDVAILCAENRIEIHIGSGIRNLKIGARHSAATEIVQAYRRLGLTTKTPA